MVWGLRWACRWSSPECLSTASLRREEHWLPRRPKLSRSPWRCSCCIQRLQQPCEVLAPNCRCRRCGCYCSSRGRCGTFGALSYVFGPNPSQASHFNQAVPTTTAGTRRLFEGAMTSDADGDGGRVTSLAGGHVPAPRSAAHGRPAISQPYRPSANPRRPSYADGYRGEERVSAKPHAMLPTRCKRAPRSVRGPRRSRRSRSTSHTGRPTWTT